MDLSIPGCHPVTPQAWPHGCWRRGWHTHTFHQNQAPRIRLIIELIKNKSFTLREVARQSSVLVFAAGKNIHSHLLINKAISIPQIISGIYLLTQSNSRNNYLLIKQ